MIKEIQKHHNEGLSQRKLAKMYHMSRHTISKCIEGDAENLALVSRKTSINFDNLRNEIIALLKEYTVKDAYFESIKLGYNGKLTQFYKKCNELFEEYNLPRLKKSSNGQMMIPTNISYHYVKRIEIFKYIWNRISFLSDIELEQITKAYPIINSLKSMVTDFRAIFTEKSIIKFCKFIIDYKESTYKPIRSFIKSILKDIRPISNAIYSDYSNGFVEGTNNKLKMIKRQSYGRCKLELLRAKIILQSF